MINLTIPYKYKDNEVDWVGTNSIVRLYLGNALKQIINTEPINAPMTITVKPVRKDNAYTVNISTEMENGK